ncbi:MAG: AAA family ATPase [bacterium]
MSGRIYLITGLMASGKTTVAQALAQRFPKSVHVHGDSFRKMIVNGQASMSFELSDDAKAQLGLRYDLAAQAAKGYADAGYTVVYQDIILGPTLAEVVGKFDGYDLSVVVLEPDADTISKRETSRGKSGYRNRAEIDQFDKVLREDTARVGTWIDSTGLSVAQTVARILESGGE